MGMKYPCKVLYSNINFHVHVVPTEFPTLPPELQAEVDARWEAIEKADPGIPNTPLINGQFVTRHTYDLMLRCGSSNRKMFMCTTEMPTLPPEYVHRSVAQCAVTTTRDNMLIIGIREVRTAYPNARHVAPAGRLEVSEKTPLQGVYAEYEEELGLRQSDVEVRCIGVVSDQVLRMGSIQFIYRGITNLTAHELLERAAHAKSATEYVHLEVFPWNPDFLRKHVLLPYPRRFVPDGFAGIALALREDFGNDAFPDWEVETGTAYTDYMKSRNELVL
jgi:8-oxo-dGTP pyrophosphatase MutT (NUDIX family)